MIIITAFKSQFLSQIIYQLWLFMMFIGHQIRRYRSLVVNDLMNESPEKLQNPEGFYGLSIVIKVIQPALIELLVTAYKTHFSFVI